MTNQTSSAVTVSDERRVTAEDRLRLHVHDPETFSFDYDDAGALVLEIDVLRSAPAPEWQGMRNQRQEQVAEWCAAAFGADHQASVPQRGLRMLEEAIEAYQATEGNAETAHKLVDYIFAKEPGELAQELGGVGVTVLALAAAAGLSADDAEAGEVARVLSKPLAWFHARNKVKNDAGFDATAYPTAPKGADE